MKKDPKTANARILLFFVLIFWLVLGAPAASAHANLIRSEPAAHSAQTTPPTRVRLWFSEDTEPNFSHIAVLSRAGAPVDKGDSGRLGNDPSAMQVSLTDLPDGSYTVVWRASSAVDGHVTSGSFSFTVGAVPLDSSSPFELMSQVDTALAAAAPPPLFEVLVRWLNLLFLVLLVGGLAFPLLVLFPALRAAAGGRPLLRSLREYLSRKDAPDNILASTRPAIANWFVAWLRFERVALLLFAVASVAALIAQAATLGGGAETVVRLATGTRFGTIWLIRMATLGLLFLLLFRPPQESSSRPRPSRRLLLINALGLVIVATQSLNSHDAAMAAPPLLPFFTDFVHLWGVAIWGGGLFQLIVTLPALLRALPEATKPQLLARVIALFSIVALAMVGLIVVSGAYSMVLQVGSMEAFFATLYGTTLAAKFALLFVVLVIAALNLLVSRPAAARALSDHLESFARRFTIAVTLEALIIAALLLTVGFLTSLAPARTAYNPTPTFWLGTHRVPDPSAEGQFLSITLAAAPGLVGTNDFDIKVQDTNGQPVSNANPVRLFATMSEMEMGTQQMDATAQGHGHYTVKSDVLSMVAVWQLQTLVRRPGMDDVRATFPIIALGQRLPPPAPPLLATSPQGQAGLLLTIVALGLGAASALALKRRTAKWITLGGAIVVSAIGGMVAVQAAATQSAAPYVVPSVPGPARLVRSPLRSDPTLLAVGRQLYQQNCATCHGSGGKGNGPSAANLNPKPADLTIHVPQHTDGELYWWITHGIPTTAMPAWESLLSDLQRWQVIAFLRTIGQPGPTPSPVSAQPASTILFVPPDAGGSASLTMLPRGQTVSYTLVITNIPAASVAPAAPFLELTPLESDRPVRRVEFNREPDGRYTASDAATSDAGMWRIRLVAARPAAPELRADFPFYSEPSTPAATVAPEALAWLRDADAAMNRLRSVRAQEILNDGANAVVVTAYVYATPDRMHFHIGAKTESIVLGPTQYDLTQGKWSSRPRVEPFLFPRFDIESKLTHAALGRAENLNGIPTQVVLTSIEYFASPIYYAYWIGIQDHLIHQFAMVAEGHLMMQTYYDYDAPVQIVPPAGVSHLPATTTGNRAP